MRSSRNAEDLSAEPGLGEMLADPIVQALMACDGVREEEIVQLSLAARTRLARTREAVVMQFPGPSRAASGPVMAEPERRPRTRWPFQLRTAVLKQAE